MRHWKLLALVFLTFAMLSAPRPASASVAINIGVEPVCPYGYFDYAPYSCAPYGYYGPEWFNGASLSESVPGSMAHMASSATWITALIHITAITARFRSVETGPSITFAETRCAMDKATSAAVTAAAIAEALFARKECEYTRRTLVPSPRYLCANTTPAILAPQVQERGNRSTSGAQGARRH